MIYKCIALIQISQCLYIDLDPAERSVVEQYEHRLATKRQEVIELQRQRDELRKTHARLVLLQSQILTPKVHVLMRERENGILCSRYFLYTHFREKK